MLLREQFPRWQHLPLRPVVDGGNDHRIFRLGDDLCVRLPSAPEYVPQVAKEQTWLARLAPRLPLPVPSVRGIGEPSERFGAPWSVYDWLPGESASTAAPQDIRRFAADLASFLVALRAVDGADGPEPGRHSAFRGGPIAHWDPEMRHLIRRVDGRERDLASGIWRDALAARFRGPAQWFHGDVSANNLLVRDGALAAVIDFGCAGVGDPACDTVIAWTFFTGSSRALFRRELDLDETAWARGRGWALWKGLIMLTNKPAGQAQLGRRVLDHLFAERGS